MEQKVDLLFVVRAIPTDTGVREIKAQVPEGAIRCIPEDTGDPYSTFCEALKVGEEVDAGVVHMESAVRLSDNFYEFVQWTINSHEGCIVQFFSMREADLQEGSRMDTKFVMTTCFYVPKAMAYSLRKFVEEGKGEFSHYDEAVDKWLILQGIRYYIACPNPVDRVTTSQWVSKTFKP